MARWVRIGIWGCVLWLWLFPGVHIDRLARSRAVAVPVRSIDAIDLAPLMRVTERLRGLKFRQPVPVRPLTDATLRQLLNRQWEQYATQLQAEAVILRLLGLLRSNEHLRQLLDPLYQQQVAGVYDPLDKVMYVRTGTLAGWTAMIVVHELAHALVDQHFDLRAYIYADDIRQDSERMMVRRAVAEGDATIVMLAYAMEQAGMAENGVDWLKDADPDAFATIMTGLDLQTYLGAVDLPEWIVQLFLSPYVYGMRICLEAYRRNGWAGVNRLYRDPPETSAQLMHLDRYFHHRPGRRLQVDVSETATVRYRGWIGELVWQVWLDHFLEEDVAQKAATGWDGDGAVLLESNTGQWTFIAITEWVREQDAQEFVQAAREALHRRDRLSGLIPIRWHLERTGRRVRIEIRRVRGEQ